MKRRTKDSKTGKIKRLWIPDYHCDLFHHNIIKKLRWCKEPIESETCKGCKYRVDKDRPNLTMRFWISGTHTQLDLVVNSKQIHNSVSKFPDDIDEETQAQMLLEISEKIKGVIGRFRKKCQ